MNNGNIGRGWVITDGGLGRDPKTLAREQQLEIKRRKLMLDRGIKPMALKRRWEEMHGSCSKAMVSDVITGRSRSELKERDLAQLLGVEWDEIYDPPKWSRSRDTIPGDPDLA